MGRRTFAAIVSLALLVVFGAIVAATAPFARMLRIDLTEGHLYSLSDGAVKTLRGVSEPTTLTFYYSRGAGAKAPELRAHAARAREMLTGMAAASHGKISIREVDPQPFSKEEDSAIAAGLEPATTPIGDQVYLGVAGKSALGRIISVPFLDPKRDAFLEYDLTRLVAAIDQAKRTKVALVTSLPLRYGAGGPAAFAQGASRPFAIYDELVSSFDVEAMGPDFTTLPADADILVVAHPWPLSPQQLYAIDQFVMDRGRAVFLVDPASWIASPASGASQYAAPFNSDLRPLFEPWGIAVSNSIVADKDRALPIEVTNAEGRSSVAPQPLFLRLTGDDLSRRDPVTASLPRGVHLALPGALSLKAGSAFTMSPLLQSSENASQISVAAAFRDPAPAAILQNYRSANKRFTIAARFRGEPASAFAAATPPIEDSKRLLKAKGPTQLIVVADADLLEDGFYVDPQSKRSVADNAALIVNAVESLSGADSLLSLRARIAPPRPMTRLDDMRARTSEKLAVEEARLSRELEATEARLRILRSQTAQRDRSVQAATSIGEIERFQARALDIRTRLRAIHRTYTRDIETLRTRLLALNTLAAPALLAFAGIIVGLRRRWVPKKARDS